MSNELEALDRLWNETKGIFNTSSFSNRSDRDLIKQALIDKDKLQTKLEEWARDTYMDDISRKELFKILRESE